MSGTEKLFEKAREAFEKRNYDYAIELFLNILKVDPNHVEGRRALRMTEMKKHQELGGGSKIGKFFGKANSSILKVGKNPEKLLDKAEGMLRKDPTDAGVRVALANALKQLGHFNGAAVEFEGALELDQENVEAMKSLCECYQQLNRVKEAKNIIQRASKLAPADGDAQRMLRSVMALEAIDDTQSSSGGNFRDNIKDKDKARELEQAGRLTVSDEDMASGERQYLAAVEADPSDIKSWKKLGELYFKARKYKQAMEAYTNAHKANPADSELRMLAGDARVKLYDQYITKYKKALQDNSGDSAAKEKLKKYQTDRLRFQIKEWEQRSVEHPTDMSLKYQLGEFYLAGNLTDKAIQQFQATVKDPKRKIRSMLHLGTCFRKKKLYDLAANQLNGALASGELPSDQVNDVRYQLGRTYEESGDVEGALKAYKSVMEVDINYEDVMKRIEALSA